MNFSWNFVFYFAQNLLLAAPLMAMFVGVICLLGLLTGRLERWHWVDGLYYAFITATTVGYGDFRPLRRRAKVLSVLIAFCGVTFTGIFVSIAVGAASQTLVGADCGG